MTKSSKLNPSGFEADAREHRIGGRIITVEDLHQHVLDLAADLRIERTDGFPKADFEADYAVALHDIGAIREGPFDDVLIEERRAWEWARANALVWTPTMQREADRCMRAYDTDEAHRAAYYYEEILAFGNDLVGGNADRELVCDALVRNAVELAEMCEKYDLKEARRVLIRLIDKYLPAD
jgi:hypothetical protein